ncbi:MAG: GNAT family N-acetyltransferase [Candidatus Bipolaricaulia bacterium]
MIRYQSSTDGTFAEDLQGFFMDWGWPNPPSPETHLRILQNSDYAFLAYDDEAERVVGYINAISDGVLSAYIPLLEVLEPYQGQGIGSELVRRMLDQLEGLYMIDVMCDPELEPFYARFGFTPGFGMMVRNYRRQSGPV